MTENFKKLKNKYLKLALVKSAIVGVFSALFVVGVVLLGIKLSALRIAPYYYAIIGIGTCAIAFGVTFLLTRHSDKSLSKKLDSEYGLNEKVQTMVEYANQESDIINIQRADTEEKLANLPKKKISFAKIWQYVVVAVLGLSFFLPGIIIPSKYVAPVVPDDYKLNEWDAKSLEQLISDVQGSDLEDEVKLPTITALEKLYNDLQTIKTNTDMRTAVRKCAESVDDAVISANSYRDIALAINPYEELDNLKLALVSAGECYKTDAKINSMSIVKERANSSEDNIRKVLMVFTNAFSEKVNNSLEAIDIKNYVEPFNDALTESMVDLIETLSENGLFKALSDFSVPLGTVIEEYAWRDDLKSLVSNACTELVSSASKDLVRQVYNRIMDDFIFTRLNEIFGVSVYQDELDLPGVSDGDSNTGDDPSHGGGSGDEEVIYGGDGVVYDPNSAEHVQYGKVWNDYVAKLYERLNDEQSGLSEEMKSYIMEYIKILDGSSNGSEEGEN